MQAVEEFSQTVIAVGRVVGQYLQGVDQQGRRLVLWALALASPTLRRVLSSRLLVSSKRHLFVKNGLTRSITPCPIG